MNRRLNRFQRPVGQLFRPNDFMPKLGEKDQGPGRSVKLGKSDRLLKNIPGFL